MKTGRALIVGLRYVDGAAYGGREYRDGCFGSELDADNIHRILDPLGFVCAVLKTPDATSLAILTELDLAAAQLTAGDLFVFYFSGHGGQNPDESGDEADDRDETLYAFDRRIVDDELDVRWRAFESGVRILMISDSCNSGTNYQMVATLPHAGSPLGPVAPAPVAAPGIALDAMRAAMLHIGAARDSVNSIGYAGGGAFTIALSDIWQQGQFVGNYQSFFDRIKARVPDQFPQFNKYGTAADALTLERPFTI